jgi:pyruvate dehydrogenase E2 component (dihydrolipoamide acetyltransferase)
MATPIIMPKFGQMTEESAIVEWRKAEGDKVAKGDILFTVETDKSVMDVESFEAGTLLKIVVQPGVNIPVQSTVGFLGQPGEPIPAVSAPAPAPKPAEAPRAASSPAPAAQSSSLHHSTTPSLPVSPTSKLQPSTAAQPLFRISPRAAALARSCVIDPARIPGSGPNGRVVEKDVQGYLESKGYNRLRVSPAAKEIAAKEKLDLLAIQGSGDSARITVADVERAIAERPKPMSKMRQVIAQRLSQSVVTAPHFFVTVEVDMTPVVQFRSQLKEKGLPYTLTDFISQAVILSLKKFPEVNSSTDGKSIRWNSHVHLGLAVSLEQGLVVPVIRDADELTLAELNARSKELADKARSGKLGPDEMTGSTFTISNMGMLDVENFTAIINTGEAAILAVSSTLKKPVVRDEKVVVRSIMKMTLSSDHRLIDGAMAAKFNNAIKLNLEDIELWKRLTS